MHIGTPFRISAAFFDCLGVDCPSYTFKGGLSSIFEDTNVSAHQRRHLLLIGVDCSSSTFEQWNNIQTTQKVSNSPLLEAERQSLLSFFLSRVPVEAAVS